MFISVRLNSDKVIKFFFNPYTCISYLELLFDLIVLKWAAPFKTGVCLQYAETARRSQFQTRLRRDSNGLSPEIIRLDDRIECLN